MSRQVTRRLSFLDRFGVRLGLILTLALAPVGIIALVRSADIDAQARARTEAALAGETLRAAVPRVGRISDAQGTAQALAKALPLISADACQAVLRSMTGEGGSYSFAALYEANGQARCTSDPGMQDVSARPFLADFAAAPRPLLQMIRSSPDGVPDLLVAIAPVPGNDLMRGGFVAVAPLQTRIIPTTGPDRDFAVMLFDRNGNVLSASRAPDWIAPLLPRDQPLKQLFGQPDRLFSAPDSSGAARLYSLNSVLSDDIYALGTWPEEGQRLTGRLPPLFLPAAMWAACLMAAWLAAEMMVTRHMRRFRRAITAFADGDRRLRPVNLSGAPSEVRDAAEAFDLLTETILKDEADLENAVREREALLREVHHRVKNNLQLMASIMNLQLRRTRSDEAKTVMRRLQDRMLSLATIHNSLFHTASMTEVQAAPLLSGIVDQIIVSGAGAGQRFDIEAAFQPFVISPEQVVPLALLITEALGRAMKTAGTAGEGLPHIEITLSHAPDGAISLRVVNQTAPGFDEDELTGDDGMLGNQLIQAFALQLDGIYSREIQADRQVQMLDFRLKTMTLAPADPVPQG